MVQNYVQYLQNVLGIKGFIRPEEVTQKPPRFFFLMSPASLQPESVSDLFKKIIQAMKLEQNEFQVVQSTQSEISQILTDMTLAEAIICTDKDIYEFVRISLPHSEIILIPDLQSMMDQPQLKKQAWDQLKKLI